MILKALVDVAAGQVGQVARDERPVDVGMDRRRGRGGVGVENPPLQQQERPVLGLRGVTRRSGEQEEEVDAPVAGSGGRLVVRDAVDEAERWAVRNGAGSAALMAAVDEDWADRGYLRTTGFFFPR